MRVGFFHLAMLVFVVSSPGHASAATVDSDKRLVIVESSGNRLSRAAREHLRSAIGEAVTRRGLQLVSSQTLPDKLLRCDLPGCLPQIAGASGAMLVLRVEAKYAKESFKLALDLWNSDEGKLLGHEERDCPICDEQDLWGSAALLVQGLLDRALREARKTTEPPPLAPAATPVASVQTAPPALAVHPAQSDGSASWAGYAGLTLGVAGAALVGAGIYYMAVDGDLACKTCDWKKDTASDGRRLAIGGGAALAVGAGLLLWRFWPAAPTVALGPSGLLVAGRFQ
jgi:hypothetical protein